MGQTLAYKIVWIRQRLAKVISAPSHASPCSQRDLLLPLEPTRLVGTPGQPQAREAMEKGRSHTTSGDLAPGTQRSLTVLVVSLPLHKVPACAGHT